MDLDVGCFPAESCGINNKLLIFGVKLTICPRANCSINVMSINITSTCRWSVWKTKILNTYVALETPALEIMKSYEVFIMFFYVLRLTLNIYIILILNLWYWFYQMLLSWFNSQVSLHSLRRTKKIWILARLMCSHVDYQMQVRQYLYYLILQWL